MAPSSQSGKWPLALTARRMRPVLADWHASTPGDVTVFDNDRRGRIAVRAFGAEPGTRLYLRPTPPPPGASVMRSAPDDAQTVGLRYLAVADPAKAMSVSVGCPLGMCSMNSRTDISTVSTNPPSSSFGSATLRHPRARTA